MEVQTHYDEASALCPDNFPNSLSEEDILLFDQLLLRRDYQEIEDIFKGKDKDQLVDPIFCKFLHYLYYKPLEYIKELFKDRTRDDVMNSVNIVMLTCPQDDMLEGFLIYALRRVAARGHRTNLDEMKFVKNLEEKIRKTFKSDNCTDIVKKKYIDEGTYPACVISLQDLINHGHLNDTWHNIKEWYEFFDKQNLLSIDELRKEFDQTPESSILRFGIKFFIAKKYNIDIDTDNLTNVLKEIKKAFTPANITDYYGLHIISINEELPCLIYALLQPEFNFPLVVQDVSNPEYIELDKSSRVRSGWSCGSRTTFGTYKVSNNNILAFKSYDWYESDSVYLTQWLIFKDFTSKWAICPVSVGIKWNNTIII